MFRDLRTNGKPSFELLLNLCKHFLVFFCRESFYICEGARHGSILANDSEIRIIASNCLTVIGMAILVPEAFSVSFAPPLISTYRFLSLSPAVSDRRGPNLFLQ